MTSAPDYISPIIGCRIWHWDGSGLRSLNGERWRPGEPLEARCRICEFAKWKGRGAGHSAHDAPHIKCSCGIYARKGLEHFRWPGYTTSLIHGQVLLWGTVVEHQQGWRAQYAYPRSLLLPSEDLPVTLMEIKARLMTLTAYRCDISIVHDSGSVLLWKNESGFMGGGLDYLMSRAGRWYVRHNQGNAMQPGDRVAILGRGIAVVERLNDTSILVKLRHQNTLRIARKQVSWNRQNLRWETDARECCDSDGHGLAVRKEGIRSAAVKASMQPERLGTAIKLNI